MEIDLREFAGAKATLVFFSSNECPVALAYEQELAAAMFTCWRSSGRC